jgi:hypothetical protein
MKKLYTGQSNDITFPLSTDAASSYKVTLTKIVGSGELDYQNLIDVNVTDVFHYDSAHYSPLHYSADEVSVSTTGCFTFAHLRFSVPSETLGGEYVLNVYDQASGLIKYYTSLSKVESDLSISDYGGSTTTISQHSVYSDSKII